MQLTAKLIQLLPIQTGIGKNGPWKKQLIIVETLDQNPCNICLAAWGNKTDLSQLKIGSKIKIDFQIQSREYNGKWFTDLKVLKIESFQEEAVEKSKKVIFSSSTSNEVIPDDFFEDNDVEPDIDDLEQMPGS